MASTKRIDRKYTGSRDNEVCPGNILMVAIYFRLPAIWDENFILNEERIRHNEVIPIKTIKIFENFRNICTVSFEITSLCRIRSSLSKKFSSQIAGSRK